MAKYRKHNNNAKKIKQASKDYGTERRSNIEENINQMSSSYSSKDSNTRYDETTDPTSSQHKSFENSDLSRDKYSGRTELKQSEANTISPNKKNEELKPLVVYDIAAKDGINEVDTSISTKKSVSVLPYAGKYGVMTSIKIHLGNCYMKEMNLGPISCVVQLNPS